MTTTTTINLNTLTLGEIACTLAGATQVFRKYKLDFCCAGNRTLEEALTDTTIPTEQLLHDLEALSVHTEGNPEQFDDNTLIDHIITNYHDRHRRDLPELIALAAKVENRHLDKAECPVGLSQLLVQIFDELSSHMQKEEQV